MKPRVIYYETLNFLPENLQLLEDHFDLVRLESPDDDTVNVLAAVDGIIAPLKYYWGKEKIDLCNRLRVIASHTGLTPHIDVPYANSKGIRVIHLQGEFDKMNITPTPELTWGLILAVTRRIPWSHRSIINGKWNRRDWASPQMLSNMELGIVGAGRVGRRVARFGIGFGMVVRYYDPHVYSSPVAEMRRVDTLAELVSQSDIVSLHVMLSNATKNLIDRDVLRAFRRGAYLINTARGPLLDSSALLEALESGHIAGAALDVIPEEFDHDFVGDVREHPLVQYAQTHDNLLITPHIAGSTLDAWHSCQERIIHMLIEELNK